MLLNRIDVIGYVGREPIFSVNPDGSSRSRFTLAHHKKFKDDKGNLVDHVTWFVVWARGRNAEIVRDYVRKGLQVHVEGALVSDRRTGGPRLYQNEQGEWRTGFEINANLVAVLGTRPETQRPATATQPVHVPVALKPADKESDNWFGDEDFFPNS